MPFTYVGPRSSGVVFPYLSKGSDVNICDYSYSIAYGLIAGITTYILLNGTAWIIEKLSGGRITPYAKEIKDPWTWRIPGGFFPPWVVRLSTGKAKFWENDLTDGEGENGSAAQASEKSTNNPTSPHEADIDMQGAERS